MHFIKNILTLISSLLFVTVSQATNFPVNLVDSVYHSMLDFEKITALTLVHASSDLDTSYARYSGFYYTAPLKRDAFDQSKMIVAALDENLKPWAKETQLMSLSEIASVRDANLRREYIEFFASFCRSKGVDLCVLPAVDDKNARLKTVLDEFKSIAPDFFLIKEELSYLESKKKNELRDIFDSKRFWVFPAEFSSVAFQKIDRYATKIIHQNQVIDSRVKNNLALQVHISKVPAKKLSGKTRMALYKSSVVPLEKTKGVLPLQADTICLISNDPYGSMANMLRKYTYVITANEEISTSKSPVIIDNEVIYPANYFENDRTIIYVGDIYNFAPYASHMEAALLYAPHRELYQYVIPQMLFGATDITGVLTYTSADGNQFVNRSITGYNALGYIPADLSAIDQDATARLNAILNEAVTTRCTPGGQLLVALGGSIIVDKPFGYLTYDSLIPSDKNTLYDLASVTKVGATLLAIMKLYEDQKIDLDAPLSRYLPQYTGSNKEHITIRSVLAHNAGLKSYVPFWQKVISSELIETFYYEDENARQNDIRSYGMQANTSLRDTLNNWILQSPLIKFEDQPHYNYSDIGFMILHQVVEAVSQTTLDNYLNTHFYQPLRLSRYTFNPMDKGFERFEIAPTEREMFFRHELIWGEVHDRNAAVFGGVAGHAGLFANAYEAAVVMQMLLQGGSYGGVRVLNPTTINYFNQAFYPDNRRALGWDKPDAIIGNTSTLASTESYGHTGFTGTMVWVDPKYDLVFIFLSNRVFPNANNNQLIRSNIRTRLQDVIYESIVAKWMN